MQGKFRRLLVLDTEQQNKLRVCKMICTLRWNIKKKKNLFAPQNGGQRAHDSATFACNTNE